MKYAALCSIALAVQLYFQHVVAAGGSGDGQCSFQTSIQGGSGADAKLEQMNQFVVDDSGTQETTNFG